MKSYLPALTRHRMLGRLTVLAGLVAASACDTNKLVTVTDPALLTPENVNTAAATPGLVQGALRQKLPDAPWREAVSNVGYSIGFLMVILGRMQSPKDQKSAQTFMAQLHYFL